MNKTEFYLSRCAHAASASDMQFTLGSILVKGGKILASGHNHHRTHYDGVGAANPKSGSVPFSMHAEMHAIYNATGRITPPRALLNSDRMMCATHEASAIRYVLPGSSADEGSLLLDSGQDGVDEPWVL